MPIRRAEVRDRELPYLWDSRHARYAAYVKRDYQGHNLVHTQVLHVYSGELPDLGTSPRVEVRIGE